MTSYVLFAYPEHVLNHILPIITIDILCYISCPTGNAVASTSYRFIAERLHLSRSSGFVLACDILFGSIGFLSSSEGSSGLSCYLCPGAQSREVLRCHCPSCTDGEVAFFDTRLPGIYYWTKLQYFCSLC